MGNVGIEFKEFVYIYNFTCFELKRMDLKSHGNGRNQKNFPIFYVRLTSIHNCKSRIQWIGKILFVSTSIYIYIYIYWCETSCGKVWGSAK